MSNWVRSGQKYMETKYDGLYTLHQTMYTNLGGEYAKSRRNAVDSGFERSRVKWPACAAGGAISAVDNGGLTHCANVL